jgi:hypothetical protein
MLLSSITERAKAMLQIAIFTLVFVSAITGLAFAPAMFIAGLTVIIEGAINA